MLEHIDPNFQENLEAKTYQRLRDHKALQPEYDGTLVAAPKEEPQQFYYIEKYATDNTAHGGNNKNKRLVPISRGLTKVGADGALVKIE